MKQPERQDGEIDLGFHNWTVRLFGPHALANLLAMSAILMVVYIAYETTPWHVNQRIDENTHAIAKLIEIADRVTKLQDERYVALSAQHRELLDVIGAELYIIAQPDQERTKLAKQLQRPKLVRDMERGLP